MTWLGSISFPLDDVLGDMTWHGAVIAPVLVLIVSAWLARVM